MKECIYQVDMPEWDKEKCRPKTKLPSCPRCGLDELTMFDENGGGCYGYNLKFTRRKVSHEKS